MTSASAFSRLMGSVLTLLPLCVAAESHMEAAVTGRKVSAVAHVDFRIIIPRVLSLDVASGTLGPGAQRAAIYSNSRTATLSSTLPGAAVPARRVILVAAARKVIAEETPCVPSSGAYPHGVICTVSMP